MTIGINKASHYNCYNTFEHEPSLKGALQTNHLHVFITFTRPEFVSAAHFSAEDTYAMQTWSDSTIL